MARTDDTTKRQLPMTQGDAALRGGTPRPLPDVARHSIRHAASAARVHPQTLREYERRGLLSPARTSGGMRLFTDREVAQATRIRALTDDGIPMKAARRVLRLEDVLELAFDRIRVLEDQNRRLSTRLQRQQEVRRAPPR